MALDLLVTHIQPVSGVDKLTSARSLLCRTLNTSKLTSEFTSQTTGKTPDSHLAAIQTSHTNDMTTFTSVPELTILVPQFSRSTMIPKEK